MIRHGNIEVLALVTHPSGGRLPLGPVVLPLSPGVTALYGLNGAGKSLILEALREVLTGVQGERTFHMNSMLYVQPEASAVEFSEDMWDLHVCGLAAGLYEELSPRGDSLLDLVRPFTRDEKYALPEALFKWRSVTVEQFKFHDTFFEDIDIDDVLIEILRQKRFLMQASGSRSNPSWILDLALTREPDVVSAVPYLDLCDQGMWRDEHGEFPIRRAALPVENSQNIHEFTPALYRLETFSDWKVADLRFRVMGNQDFDPDSALRETLDDFGRWKFESLLDLAAGPTPSNDMGSLLRDAVRGVRGEIPGLTKFFSGPWIVVDDDGLAPESGLYWLAKLIAMRANTYYSLLLRDAPRLEIDLKFPWEWAAGNPPQWGVFRGDWVALDKLSAAERRWAAISVELALAPHNGGFLLIDEPEVALHRSAEQYMASGLAKIAQERQLAVVVATHSPELLDDPDTHVYLVRRSDQDLLSGHQVHRLAEALRVDLREFGLLPSDLLRRQRGFLFVEGQHDLIVLESLIGDELRNMRIEILPMRGAGKLGTVLDSRVLFDFTDAHFFVLLDALRSDEIARIWNESIRLAKTDSLSSAIDFADRSLKALKLDEASALAAFITRALERDLASRHTPIGLSLPDILDYLPVTAFVPEAESWEQLREELARSAGSRQSGSKFKQWLKSAKRADLSPENIERICDQLDYIPDDFVHVLRTLTSVFATDS